MANIENAISNLERNIRWICDNPAYQSSGLGNVEMAMRDALELLKEQDAEKKCCRDCEYYGACHDN